MYPLRTWVAPALLLISLPWNIYRKECYELYNSNQILNMTSIFLAKLIWPNKSMHSWYENKFNTKHFYSFSPFPVALCYSLTLLFWPSKLYLVIQKSIINGSIRCFVNTWRHSDIYFVLNIPWYWLYFKTASINTCRLNAACGWWGFCIYTCQTHCSDDKIYMY